MSKETILSELSLFEGNDEMLYDYIISKSKILPLLDESERNDVSKIHGCMSLVYIQVNKTNSGTIIKGFSDSSILSGILGILSDIVNDDLDPSYEQYSDILEKLKFVLSQNRRLGFQTILSKIFYK
jgi:sulfur transfer protein SufE